jgi:hypothetical protein
MLKYMYGATPIQGKNPQNNNHADADCWVNQVAEKIVKLMSMLAFRR